MKIITAHPGFHAARFFDKTTHLFKCARCERELPDRSFPHLKDAHYQYDLVKFLHVQCKTCRAQLKGKWINHPDYSIKLDQYWSKRISGIRQGGFERGLLVTIDKDDLLGKYLDQNGLCAITGLKMEPYGGMAENGLPRFNTPSVDRIDNNGNYTIDNVHLVLNGVNTMKGTMLIDAFYEICSVIASRSLSLL
jgi:hypothetical protein